MTTPAYYKVLSEGGQPFHGGTGRWTKGPWRSVKGEIVPCANGLHACTIEQLRTWLGPVIWRIEFDGEVIDAGDKVVGRKARITERLTTWNDRTARLFAADCAERALPLYENRYPTDDRPRKVIEAARAFARGEIDRKALAAAWDAARAAAGAAAWAARDAAWAAWAARDAEVRWQSDRLARYLSGELS